jgi:arsenate reductase-like glutaredoxin family protein
VQRFGLTPLIDRASKRYAELGLGAARLSDERWMTLLAAEPLLLAQPLTRHGKALTIGVDEPEWSRWVAAERTA